MKRRNGESGFAMLLVFVLAAAIAITLYMEIPRVVFESERAKEQILVDRGNQYKRAIQLYYRYNLKQSGGRLPKYPSKIDDLESSNNIRFLRHRFKDPLTGKDEWRLIHIGPTGQLTDSLVQKFDPLKSDKDKNLNASNSPGGSTGDPSTGADPRALWANGRPSDKVLTGANGGPPPDPQDPNAPPQPQQPQQPQYPGQPQYPQPQYIAGQPSFPQYPQVPAGQPGFAPQPFPNQPYNPLQPNQPPNPGQPGQPNTAAGIISQLLTTPRQPPPGIGFPGQGGYQPQPGYPPQPGYQPRYDANGNLLPPQPPRYDANGNLLPPGTPNAGGAGGIGTGSGPGNTGSGFAFNNTGNNTGISANTGSIPSNNATNATGGGLGIAGVASTASGSGIKVINDRQKFKEWEFVYDVTKDKPPGGGVPNPLQQNPQQQNPLQQNPPPRRLPGSGQ